MIKKLVLLWALLCPLTAQAVHIVSREAHVDVRSNRVIHIVGPIFSSMSWGFLVEGATTLHGPGARVLIINSPGGEVGLGQKMIDVLLAEREQTGQPLVCAVIGHASSMAFNILSYCDVRLAVQGSEFTVHKIEGDIPDGYRHTAENLRKMAKVLDSIDEVYRKKNAEMMHLSLKAYDHYANQEKSWTVDELLKLGYLNGTCTVDQ